MPKYFSEKYVIYYIIVFYWLLYLFISFSIPVDGDGALHASTIEGYVESGTLLDKHAFTITDDQELLPVFYPKLFYTLMFLLRQLVGTAIYFFIVPTLGICMGIFSYLIAKEIWKSEEVGIFATLITLSSIGVIPNAVQMFRMETMVIALSMASFYALIKHRNTENYKWLILSIIFYAGCLGTKQQAYMYAPIYALTFLTYKNTSAVRKIKNLLIFFFISFIIASPVLIEEFLSTGTLFYPGVPIVGKIEKVIADAVNIRLYSVGEGWKTYAVGSDRIQYLNQKFSNIKAHIGFLDPFSGLSNIATYYFSIFALAIGTIKLIKKKEISIIIFLLLGQGILYVQPLERYFLLNQVLAAIVIASALKMDDLVKERDFLYSKVFLTSTILIFVVLSTVTTTIQMLNVEHYSYGRPSYNRLKEMVIASKWLKANTDEESIIITPRTHLISYHAQRKALWLNQVGGEDIYEAFLENDTQRIYDISHKYKKTYILIPKFWVIDGNAEGLWIPYIEQKTVNNIDAEENMFKKVYESEKVVIYEVL